MSDDSRPEGEPVAPPPEEPVTAETPADEPTVADATSEAPAAEQPGYAAPAAAEPAAAAPAQPAQPAATAPVAAAPAATAPPPERRGGVFVPTWLAIVIAILLIGGVGFAIGYVSGDDGGSDSSNAASSQEAPSTRPPTRNVPGNGNTAPNGGNNTAPNGGGNFPNGRNASQTAFLGVSVENAGNNGGARITDVRAGSPAADAGLKTGDVITKIGDTTIQSSTDLIRAVRSNEPGDSVTVTYTRDGNSTDVKVKLGSLSDATRSAFPS